MESNRKVDYCPYCGRPETISADKNLAMCSVCAMRRADRQVVVEGKDIRKLRKKLKIPPEVLASRVGITPGILFWIENGKRVVTKELAKWFETNKGMQNG